MSPLEESTARARARVAKPHRHAKPLHPVWDKPLDHLAGELVAAAVIVACVIGALTSAGAVL